jgi:cytochrome c biogenesis protein CcmG/thiol:disulfide interchange protein DsbE
MRLNPILCAIALVTAACAPLLAAADTPLAVGKPAPAFAVESLTGKKISLAQFKGKPLYINFFASWCGPCKLELPYIVKQYPAFKAKAVFLGVDELESPSQVGPFAKQMGIPYAIAIDPGSVGAAYEIESLPKSIFIDKDGIVRAIWRGYITPAIFKENMGLITSSR